MSAESGVCAMALQPIGELMDDFHIEWEKQFHVLNAPSPASTAALEIKLWFR